MFSRIAGKNAKWYDPYRRGFNRTTCVFNFGHISPTSGPSHEDTPYNKRSIMNRIIQCSIFLSLQNMGTTKIPIHEDWLCKL